MKKEVSMDLAEATIDPIWALRIPANLAHNKQVLPFTEIDGTVLVACLNDQNTLLARNLERALKLPVKLEKAEAGSLKKAIEETYGQPKRLTLGNEEATESAGSRDEVIQLGNRILDGGILRRASDIHIDPDKSGTEIKFRVAGELELFEELPIEKHLSLISRLKVLSNMDIAERREPQDGNIHYIFEGTGTHYDIRVATIPTKLGEKMTLRILGLGAENLTLQTVGMSSTHYQTFRSSIQQPHGLILVTGPTGSGKSTSFYAALRDIAQTSSKTILTIEDPVEFDLPKIIQVQVDSEKVTFAKALRSTLRHDPDVIMIGEIRDRETAEIAVTASMTGHLVLSTLHTNSAASAVTRLLNMGVEPYLLGATLRLSIAQRLVKRLCDKCAQATPITREQALLLKDPALEGQDAYLAKGCKYCSNRGYKGRIAVFEMLPIDPEIAALIRPGVVEESIVKVMREKNYQQLRDDGIAKVKQGLVHIDEIIRICR